MEQNKQGKESKKSQEADIEAGIHLFIHSGIP